MATMTEEAESRTEIRACDFRETYFHFEIDLQRQPAITITRKQPFTLNHVRIPIECRCVLTNPKTQQRTQYILTASCKTELVNVCRDVWTLPNADFCIIASETDFMITKNFGQHLEAPSATSEGMPPDRERQIGKTSDAWARHHLDVQDREARILYRNEEVIAAALENRPLISRTTFQTSSGCNVELEYPVKTINVSKRDGFYQVDTGPVLLPSDTDAGIEGFRLAYVAHNSPDWAEFIVNLPTKVDDNVTINHYSKPVRVESTKNVMIELL